MRKLAGGVLLLLCLCVELGVTQRLAQVVSSEGAWSKASGGVLQRGQDVAVGAELQASRPGGVMVDCGDSTWLSYTCKSGNCRIIACAIEGTAVQVDRVQVPGFLPSGLSNLLFKREAREPVVAAARAGGNPADAVLLLGERGVHFGPSMSRVLEGRYCLQLSSLSGANSRSIVLDWDRALDSEGVANAPGLVPGLYQIRKGPQGDAGSCVPDTDGTSAWILIASANDFQRVNGIWTENAPAATALERSGAAASAVTAVRHALLAGLAETSTQR